MRPQRFGKYTLIDRISTGGMAEVFLAKAAGVQGFEKVLAIKRILPLIAEDPDFRTMFIDEAQISARLNHPNIGQVFEFSEVDGQYFIAMEYIAGQDLRALRNRYAQTGRMLPANLALHVVARMCQGLDHAHRQRGADGTLLEIVHRDVSPPNVVISYEGAVKLIDFGIARAASRSTRTQAGKLKGKFAYMSPEQVSGATVDHRSDVFATGIVLYELLANQRPFDGESQLETLSLVRRAEPAPPSAINPEVPEEVERIVLRALAREPAARYGWASEMRADIERYFARSGTAFETRDLVQVLRAEFAGEIEAERRLMARAAAIRPEDAEDPPPRVTRVRTERMSVESAEEELRAIALASASAHEPPQALVPPVPVASAPAGWVGTAPELPRLRDEGTARLDRPLHDAEEDPTEQPRRLLARDEGPTDVHDVERGDDQRGPPIAMSTTEVGLPYNGDAQTASDAEHDEDPSESAATRIHRANVASVDVAVEDPGAPTRIEPMPAGLLANLREPVVAPPSGAASVDDADDAVKRAAQLPLTEDLALAPTMSQPAPDPEPRRSTQPPVQQASAAAPVKPKEEQQPVKKLSEARSSESKKLSEARTSESKKSDAASASRPKKSVVRRLNQLSSAQVAALTAVGTLLLIGIVVALVVVLSSGGESGKPAKAEGVGTIVVTAPAACTLRVAGRASMLVERGTPRSLSGLPAGPHTLTLVCVGFRHYEKAVIVRAGQVTSVKAELQRD